MPVQKQPFGATSDGHKADIYTLTNTHGVHARITNYGGTIVSLDVPDRKGRLGDVELGFDTLEQYIKDSPHFGCICGRYANRIAKGRFVLDGVEYTLAVNNGPNHLHGGRKGFDKMIWNAEPVEQAGAVGVRMTYLSHDGEEGYPGNLSCTLTYLLTHDNKLQIDYEARTDKPTPINLTNHSYFNLAGHGNGDILNHVLTIHADRFTPTDETQIPTGELRSVKGTPMDFTQPVPIGARIGLDDPQLRIGRGYDCNWVLNSGGGSLAPAAEVYEPNSGRVMKVLTTEPAIQLYTANHLDGHHVGKGGKRYVRHGALCLETQHYPDSPNKPHFPSTILRPGKAFRSTTVYAFSAR